MTRLMDSIVSGLPKVETLEGRLLFNSAPTFATNLADQTFGSNGALTIGINAQDADVADHLTITATSDNPNFIVSVTPNYNPNDPSAPHDTFAKLWFQGIADPIVVELYTSDMYGKEAAQRFITLATDTSSPTSPGDPYYTDVKVHRIIDGFMFQCGDATKGDGTGGSTLADLNDSFNPFLSFAGAGVLAMAKTGNPNTSNSQWFITDAGYASLDHKYIIFGQMISGQATYNTIIHTPVTGDKPNVPPVLNRVEILAPTDPVAMESGTLIIQPVNNYAGSGTVTVTLDDGNGHIVTKNIAVNAVGINAPGAAGTPAIPGVTVPGTVHVVAGKATSFIVPAFKGSVNLSWSAPDVGGSGATVTTPDATNKITITAPVGFSGAFPVTLTGTFDGDISVTRTFTVVVDHPSDPVIDWGMSTYLDADSESTLGTFIDSSNHRLYVASGQVGVKIFDISDPAGPKLIGLIDTPGIARNVKVLNNIAYIADGTNSSGATELAPGGLVMYNVADASHVQYLGAARTQTTDAQDNVTTRSAIDFALSADGRTAYVTEYDKGITSWNVSAPTHPVKLQAMYNLGYPGVDFAEAVSAVLKDNWLFVSDLGDSSHYGRVYILNVSNPADMKALQLLDNGMAPWGMDIVGNKLYVADTVNVKVFNISNPMSPVEMGSIKTGGAAPFQIKVYGDWAVVGRWQSGFSIFNVANPKAMADYYDYTAANATGWAPSFIDGHAIVPLETQGVTMIDLNSPMVLNSYTYTQGGVTSTFTINGPGRLIINTTGLQGDPNALIASISTANTTVASTLTITTKGGDLTLHGMTIGDIKSITAPTTNIVGVVNISGSPTSVVLGDMLGFAPAVLDPNTSEVIFPAVNIGALGIGDPDPLNAKPGVSITLGDVKDFGISSTTPIKSLSVNSWISTSTTINNVTTDNAMDLIQTPVIGSLLSAGDFQANLTLTKFAGYDSSLGSVTIGGLLSGATWSVGGGVGKITLKKGATGWTCTAPSLTSAALGDVSNSTLNIAGSAGTVAAVRWIGGKLEAASLGSLKITGATATSTAAAIPGDWNASLVIDGSALNTNLTSATVSGSILGGTWAIGGSAGAIVVNGANLSGDIDVQGTIASIAAKGGLNSAFIRSGGAIGKITLGSMLDGKVSSPGGLGPVTVNGNMTDSYLLAGVDIGHDGLIATADDNSGNAGGPQAANIASVKITGTMTNSVVSAGVDSDAAGVFSVPANDIVAAGTSRIVKMSVGTLGDGNVILADTSIDPAFVTAAQDNAVVWAVPSADLPGVGVEFGVGTANPVLVVGGLTITLKGPGSGFFDAATGNIVLNGVTAGSKLDLAGSFALPISIAAADDSALGSLTSSADVQIQAIDIDGLVGTLAVSDVANNASFDLASGITKGSMNVGGSTITFDSGALGTFTFSGNVLGAIKADSIGTLTVQGNLVADLTVAHGSASKVIIAGNSSGDMSFSSALGALTVNGNIGGGACAVLGALGTVVVTGSVTNWNMGAPVMKSATLGSVGGTTTINIAGSAGTITVWQWLGGSLEAGSITSLNATGNAKANVVGDWTAALTLDGAATATNLGSATIAGKVGSCTWTVAGAAGAITVGKAGTAAIPAVPADPAANPPVVGVPAVPAVIWTARLGTLKTLTSKGDMVVDLLAKNLATMSVTGDLSDSKVILTEPVNALTQVAGLGKLTVTRGVKNSFVRTDGDMGIVTVGAATASGFYAGIARTATTLPASANVTTNALIKSFTVKGIAGQAISMYNTYVAAVRMGTVSLVNADKTAPVAGDASRYGLIYSSISKLTYKDATTTYTWPTPANGYQWPSLTYGRFKVTRFA